jgi:hypothetical protein
VNSVTGLAISCAYAIAVAADVVEKEVERWVSPWQNATHLLHTRDWLLVLEPDAGAAVRIAALTHDAERNFPGGPVQRPDRRANDRAYRDAHQARSAQIVDQWLSEHGAGPDLRRSVTSLIRVHEWGGSPDADLLQAADSISFLETLGDQAESWMRDRGHSRERIADQFEWMYRRITTERARELARPFYEHACAALAKL